MRITERRLVGLAVAGSVLAAGVGVYWYVSTPGVASYQASSLLVIPLLFACCVWLHKRLPLRGQWAGALLIALVGPVGYLIVGGAQWWNWGQLTPLPLILLVMERGEQEGDDGGGYPAGAAGPFGPP